MHMSLILIIHVHVHDIVRVHLYTYTMDLNLCSGEAVLCGAEYRESGCGERGCGGTDCLQERTVELGLESGRDAGCGGDGLLLGERETECSGERDLWFGE